MNFVQKTSKYLLQFGVKLTIVRILLKLNKIKIFNGLFLRLNQVNNKLILNKIEAIIPSSFYEQLNDVQDKYSKTIWTFWYQGEDNAPEIVKRCFLQMREVLNDYELIVLDKYTYTNYFRPNHTIQSKLDKGLISITHFSDILRMHLLDQYGGFWIDSTIFIMERPFSDSRFYTIKNVDKTIQNISLGRWATFMIGGINPKLYRFVLLVLQEYWEHYDSVIDYFLFDYVIDIAYRNIDDVKVIIDSVQNNNANIFDVRDNLNVIVSDEQFNKLIHCNQIHKLTYKREFDDNPKTVYNRLMQLNK